MMKFTRCFRRENQYLNYVDIIFETILLASVFHSPITNHYPLFKWLFFKWITWWIYNCYFLNVSGSGGGRICGNTCGFRRLGHLRGSQLGQGVAKHGLVSFKHLFVIRLCLGKLPPRFYLLNRILKPGEIFIRLFHILNTFPGRVQVDPAQNQPFLCGN